ncbi:7755_t:CDS:2 [Dentiscutata heterogama]|uniref:7755_t:CDS:1 n=1 Tax=Dentiscutata heterogama TaxID=1316150 RepID=A0ACA9KX70_9GLOM|nr:7755_t:CDS:2 [Dentiscutata heterogama]
MDYKKSNLKLCRRVSALCQVRPIVRTSTPVPVGDPPVLKQRPPNNTNSGSAP